MATGYGPDTTLLDISAKMYASQSEFVDYSKVVKPLVDDFTKQMKANEAAIKKALLELPQMDFSKVDIQLQDKLKTAAIAMKRLYADAAHKAQNTSYRDPNFDTYTQQMNSAQNGLTLINEDLEALQLIRKNGQEGILSNLDISDWNAPVSREALTNLLSGKDNYLKDNIEFDERGAWFIDPNRTDDDPKKRVRLSEITHNKFDTGETDNLFEEIENNLITNAAAGGTWSQLEKRVGKAVKKIFKALGNEGVGMAAFDSEYFADGIETFVDIWLNKNVNINDANAVKEEKDRLRNSDLETVTGRDGVTFQKAYENYILEKLKVTHTDYYQRKKNESGFDSSDSVYNVLAGKGVSLGAQVNTANQIASKSGEVIQSYDNTSYYQWDANKDKFKHVQVNTGDDSDENPTTTTWVDEGYLYNREFQNNPEIMKWITGSSTTTTVDKSTQLLNNLNKVSTGNLITDYEKRDGKWYYIKGGKNIEIKNEGLSKELDEKTIN